MATTTTLENITATTDTKVFIAGESTAKTKADFEALTWTEIGGITNLDEVGDEREEITVEVYGAGRRLKRAGIRDAGTLALEVARDVFDGGQTIARNGFEGGKPHAFKIVLDDRPTGTTGKPTTIYCLGVILSARVVFGGPNEIVKQTFNTSLTDKPLEIPASAS